MVQRWLDRDEYDPVLAAGTVPPEDRLDDPTLTLAKGLNDAGILDLPEQVKELYSACSSLVEVVGSVQEDLERLQADMEEVRQSIRAQTACHGHAGQQQPEGGVRLPGAVRSQHL